MPASVRVLVASEHAPVRRLLSRVVRGEAGFTVAAEASSAAQAIALARELKPDVALLDFHLPRTVGLDSVRLSRIGGLDAAQAIAGEIPGTQVALLTNLDAVVGQEAPGGKFGRLRSGRGGTGRPLTLRELCFEVAQAKGPVFVDVDLRDQRQAAGRRKLLKALLAVPLSLVGVWILVGVALFVLFVVLVFVR